MTIYQGGDTAPRARSGAGAFQLFSSRGPGAGSGAPAWTPPPPHNPRGGVPVQSWGCGLGGCDNPPIVSHLSTFIVIVSTRANHHTSCSQPTRREENSVTILEMCKYHNTLETPARLLSSEITAVTLTHSVEK